MPSSKNQSISSYQSAILTEMGISSWVLSTSSDIDDENGVKTIKVEVKSNPVKTAGAVSPKEALAKLEQLKSNVEPLKETNEVLTSFTKEESSNPIFNDVLLFLGLSTVDVLYIKAEQLTEYSGYPIVWGVGEQVSFDNKRLLTPHLDSFIGKSDLKRQLWQQLQAKKS